MDKDAYRELENEHVLAMALLAAVDMALDGKEPSDFMQSFPIVRRVWDLYREKGNG